MPPSPTPSPTSPSTSRHERTNLTPQNHRTLAH
jgi:hypothetical protein